MHKYSLDKSSKKHTCPSCGKSRFVKYIDSETGEYLPDEVGRCDREESCGYHLPPRSYYADFPDKRKTPPYRSPQQTWETPEAKIDFIPEKFVEQSMSSYSANNLVTWLYSLFPDNLVEEVIHMYRIGTSNHWPGSNVFWQLDESNRPRQAKVMVYDKFSGHRDRDKGAYFVGKKLLHRIGVKSPNLVQCFYGEHLLAESGDSPAVGIVESEKTAILMTLFGMLDVGPKYVWIATGGKHGCKWNEARVNKCLQGRDVVIFPDLGAFNDWSNRSKFIPVDHLVVSDVLESKASQKDRARGLDIADFYLRLMNRNDKSDSVEERPVVKSINQLNLERMGKKNPMVYHLIDELNLKFDE